MLKKCGCVAGHTSKRLDWKEWRGKGRLNIEWHQITLNKRGKISVFQGDGFWSKSRRNQTHQVWKQGLRDCELCMCLKLTFPRSIKLLGVSGRYTPPRVSTMAGTPAIASDILHPQGYRKHNVGKYEIENFSTARQLLRMTCMPHESTFGKIQTL